MSARPRGGARRARWNSGAISVAASEMGSRQRFGVWPNSSFQDLAPGAFINTIRDRKGWRSRFPGQFAPETNEEDIAMANGSVALDDIVEAAARGALRALGARKAGEEDTALAKELIKSGFGVGLVIRAGGRISPLLLADGTGNSSATRDEV
jgi:hypothetical protein